MDSPLSSYKFDKFKQVKDRSFHDEFRKKYDGRDDFGFYLYHFTKAGSLCNRKFVEPNSRRSEINSIVEPHKRFEAMFLQREIFHCSIPHVNSNLPAVCFSESSDSSLEVHAENYTHLGVSLSRRILSITRQVEILCYTSETNCCRESNFRMMFCSTPRYLDQNMLLQCLQMLFISISVTRGSGAHLDLYISTMRTSHLYASLAGRHYRISSLIFITSARLTALNSK